MDRNRKVLFEAAYGQAAAQELRHPPVRKKWNLQNAVLEAELGCFCAPSLFNPGSSVRKCDEPDIKAAAPEPVQGGEQRERSLSFAELSVHSEIGPIRCKIAPNAIASVGVLRDFGAQGRHIERSAAGSKQIGRQREFAAGHDALGRNAPCRSTFG